MTTATTNTAISHADDAGFRAWGSELSGMLADVGLVQTEDTGQIDWTTATLPTTNTSAGYEIWEWADTLQSTAPVVMKVEYGTNFVAGVPRCWVTVGTGSDGSGSITGSQTPRVAISCGQASIAAPGTGVYPTYACHTDGFFGLIHKAGASSTSGGVPLNGVMVSRPLDTDGTLTSEGVSVTVIGGDGSVIPAKAASVSFATGTQYPDNAWSRDVAMVPLGVTASVTGSSYQVVRNIFAYPRFATAAGCFTYLSTELALGATVDVALEGSVTRTYLCMGDYASGASNQSSNTYCHAMLWE